MLRLSVWVLFAGVVCAADFATEAKALKGVEAKPFEAVACGPKGCKVCPDGTTGEMELRTILYGSFVSAHSEDALITTGGCEPHAMNFGGAVLITSKNGKWQKIWYEPGLIADQCRKVKGSDGREILVCLGTYTGQGENDEVLYAVDVSKPTEKRQINLFGISDTTMTCAAEVTGGGIVQILLTGTGVTAQVRFGKRKLTAAERRKCEAAYAQGKEPEVHVPEKHYEIRFLLRGDRFVLDEATRPAFRIVDMSR